MIASDLMIFASDPASSGVGAAILPPREACAGRRSSPLVPDRRPPTGGPR